MKNRTAFSLLEVAIVIVIIGALIAGVIGSKHLIKKARVNSAQASTRSSPISGILSNKLWLDSSLDVETLGDDLSTGDAISNWTDNSSNKSSISVSAVGLGPTYSNSINYVQAVRFDSTSATNHLELSNPEFLNGTDYTIIITEKRIDTNSSGGGNYLLGASGGFAIGYESGTAIIQTHGEAASSDNQANIEALSSYSNKPRVISLSHSIVDGNKIYINGTLANEDTSDEAKEHLSGLSTPNKLKIGNNYNGEIGEIAIFTSNLKSSLRKDVENYMMQKWNAPNNRDSNATCNGTVTSAGCDASCSISVAGSATTSIAAGASETISCDQAGYTGSTSASYTCTDGSLDTTPATTQCVDDNGCDTGYISSGGACVEQCNLSVQTGLSSITYVNEGTGSVSCDAGYDGTIAYTCSSGSVSGINNTCSVSRFVCEGGDVTDITTVSGARIHYFTTVGTSTLTCSNGTNSYAHILVVAGGGGGGGNDEHGGGGGAGGLIYDSSFSLASQDYTITVGDGGDPQANGSNSVFGSLTVIGGGAGGNWGSGSNNGSAGGSGGGGGYKGTGGSATSSQGFSGGTSNFVSGLGTYKGPEYGTSGGGGAGGVGGSGDADAGGAGGVGLEISITGSSTYYAGGGGGSSYSNQSAGGAGGNGGGGSGGKDSATAGSANTGGGGGAVALNGTTGAGGGTGIVIVRYPCIECESPCTISNINGASSTTLLDGASSNISCSGTGYTGNTPTYSCDNGAITPTPAVSDCMDNGCSSGYYAVDGECKPQCEVPSGTGLASNTLVDIGSSSLACDSTHIGNVTYNCASGGSISSVDHSGCVVKSTLSCTGGDSLDTSTISGDSIHYFTTTGASSLSCTGDNYAQILVVAGGGGGGGSHHGGGGGAGGLIYNDSYALFDGSYTVTVGSGGASQTDGVDSVFGSLTADGGGAGGTWTGGTNANGKDGGSGGGSGYNGSVGSPTSGQGFAGGTYSSDGSQYGAGGGGGAGGVGGDGTGSAGGAGGVGLSISITGSSTYYAGGGGGSVWSNESSGGAGGQGGGGTGGVYLPTAGSANTGGGGGSAGGNTSTPGASGGSGIVIIRYTGTGSL